MANDFTEYQIAQLDAQRKAKLAEALQQQAFQPIDSYDSGAMKAPISWTQGLAKMLQAYGSRKLHEKSAEDIGRAAQMQGEDYANIAKSAIGTPAQTGQPFIDEQAKFMGQQSPEGLKETPDVAAVPPASRDVLIKAMMQARDPQLKMTGLQQALQPPMSKWEPLQGPRGSLIQRNAATGEMKSVIGTEDPTLMQMLLQQQNTHRETANDPNAPWRNIIDPKKQDEARTRFGTAADVRVAKEQEDVSTSRDMVNNLDRFMFLNQNTETGGKYKIPGSQFIGTAISDDVAEMKSITDKMTPMMRQGMPGAASDRDVAMFRGATVGLDKPKEANANIAMGLKAAAQNKIDRANFIAEYVTQYGHDRGADAQWKRYLEANPIFDPSSKSGSYKLNENRIDYRDWMASGGKPVKGPGNISSKPQGGLNAQEQLELEQLRKELSGGR